MGVFNMNGGWDNGIVEITFKTSHTSFPRVKPNYSLQPTNPTRIASLGSGLPR